MIKDYRIPVAPNVQVTPSKEIGKSAPGAHVNVAQAKATGGDPSYPSPQ